MKRTTKGIIFLLAVLGLLITAKAFLYWDAKKYYEAHPGAAEVYHIIQNLE